MFAAGKEAEDDAINRDERDTRWMIAFIQHERWFNEELLRPSLFWEIIAEKKQMIGI